MESAGNSTGPTLLSSSAAKSSSNTELEKRTPRRRFARVRFGSRASSNFWPALRADCGGLAGKLTHLWPRQREGPGQGGPGSERRRSDAIAGTGFPPPLLTLTARSPWQRPRGSTKNCDDSLAASRENSCRRWRPLAPSTR
ncbi:hypothetical protein HPB50_017638 [Hyalomma asiaticum]|uniref:Uncharacterized protein n=1 Tax=Hyalomma asiaticum TaxID=266040 RepID=A0ACB7RLY4_HYAAI|nr:hypothetical protein HPB50_017638 [Hyalomma asiaticum]